MFINNIKCSINLKKFFFPLLFFLYLFNVNAKENYLNELDPGSKISFHHWDVMQSKITGYSHFSYEKIAKDGKIFILEKNNNTKPDGEVFTQKNLWFDNDSGRPKLYEEEDFRKDFRIKNVYSEKKIKTILYKSGKILEFETKTGLENIVPLEIFFLFLRKNFKQILKSDDFSFTLFLPLLAIELEDKGLPRSMSMIKMVIELKEEIITQTIFGKIGAKKLLVFPKSRLLRTLIPKDKTNFEFLIGSEHPHYILEFKVGKTKHILREVTFSK